ncbi:MAG: group II intron reverse transcriptase/maturase [Chloroflexota bacterium]
MLTALEKGVKGGKWYSLMDKVSSLGNLRAAFAKVKANKGSPGVDHQTIAMFEHCLEENLSCLAQSLRVGIYRPQTIKRVWIPKPGTNEKRPLGIPTVRDRVVQAALRNVLEPIFEQDFAQASYGFRPGRGCKDALRHVDALLQAGSHFVVDADLKSYFDTIPHDLLMARLREKIADNAVLALVDSFLRQRVMDTAEGWTPETGTPQGAVLSPLLSNIFLDPLDHLMAGGGMAMVRYADDFVILCRTEAEALEALELVRRWTASAGLVLHPTKTRIVDAAAPGGFDFLGYHFERGKRWPRAKSLRKLKDNIRGKTKRTSGHSLSAIISDLNGTLPGWFAYFQHSRPYIFDRLDCWIRMRIRSILRSRRGGCGRGRGSDHQRWPNAFFAEQGLYFLRAAHAAACQSARR